MALWLSVSFPHYVTTIISFIFFCYLEHQNYFGVDEFLGPLAVSVRRERVEEQESPVENSKDHNMRYRYRILLRSSEVSSS